MTAARIWFLTCLTFGAGWLAYCLAGDFLPPWSVLPATIGALGGSVPVLIVLAIVLPFIRRKRVAVLQKKIYLFLTCTGCCSIYGVFTAGVHLFPSYVNPWASFLVTTVILSACALFAIALSAKRLNRFFTLHDHSTLNIYNQMETTINGRPTGLSRSNKILIKSFITGTLILVLLIPTIFINDLVKERQARQAKVVTEVSDRWAQAQVLTGPYLYLPYKIINTNADKKVEERLTHLVILPDNLDVNGNISHELRVRSIYKVLLYRAALQSKGNFEFHIPAEIDSSLVRWKEAKICYGLSDFKGIEERLTITFNGADYELSPSLPSDDVNGKGLSAAVPLAITDAGKKIAFNISLKIKGSEKLHFVPLAGNSRFTLQSDWANPSFDGNNIPTVRNVSNNGFTATWNFNKANLPFGIMLKDFKFDQAGLAFGVTMIQPADGYAKTDRCIKYAILFIGLTFSLFFIIELMQKKPLHPVQYLLVGLALVVFYTLLLSFSEFISFDASYIIAAVAIILLITFYAYAHFKSAKTAGVFGGALVLLYGFTFVLIRLEDTALLIGSIGLFLILALAMYASRKINWYGEEALPLGT